MNHDQDRIKEWNLKACRLAIRNDCLRNSSVLVKHANELRSRNECNVRALRLFESMVREYLPQYQCEKVFESWKRVKYRRNVAGAIADFRNLECTSISGSLLADDPSAMEDVEAIAKVARQYYDKLMAE